jgi:hypothetical protein
VVKVIGGSSLIDRLFGRIRSYGMLIHIEKGPTNWARFNELRAAATPIDALVTHAEAMERSGEIEAAIVSYRDAVLAIVSFNQSHPDAAAHRWRAAPINRLTMLLVRQKRYGEAKAAFENWRAVRDPVGLPAADTSALQRRIDKIAR